MKTADKVKAGAKFLTEKYGEEWKAKIDLERLRMNNPKSCILGQTDSDYYVHATKLGIIGPKAAELGFDADSRIAINLCEQYDALTAAWKEYLESE